MKKDLKNLNRSLALAIAAAMALTSAPSAVFAEDVFSDSAAVVADVETEEAEAEAAEVSAEAEVASEATEEAAAEPSEAVAVEGTEEAAAAEAAEPAEVAEDLFTSDADGADAAGTDQGLSTTPAQVTGVQVVQDEDQYDGVPTLIWNYVEGAYGYRIAVKDSAGKEYKESGDDYFVSNTEFPQFYLSSMEYMHTTDASGNSVNAWQAGQTYTITVYAVNKYAAADGTTTEVDGAASAAVTYTVPATTQSTTITDLAYVSQDDEYVYFAYSGDLEEGFYYEISTSNAVDTYGNFENPADYGWYYEENSKLCLYKYSSYKKDTTYYLHVRCGYDTSGNAIWSNTTTFTIPSETPKNITGLKIEKETTSKFVFTFDSVLERGDYYRLEYSTDSTFQKDVEDNGENLTIYKKNLEAGKTYYARAIAYVYVNGEKKDGAASNIVSFSKTSAPTITGLTVAEKTPKGFVLKYTGDLNEDDRIEVWVSSDSSFASDKTKTFIKDDIDEENQYTIYYNTNDIFTPGVTYYIKARAYSDASELEDDYKEGTYYGAFTNVVTVKPTVPDVSVYATVAKTSIRLSMYTNGDYGYFSTGYVVQRKNGKKWTTISKNTNGVYTDKNLTADTAYTYRVRAYYRDKDAKKTYNGAWTYYTATTWGGNLNLTAIAKSKTSVKLSWNKIKGATGYEVYRSLTSSRGYQYSADKSYDDDYENSYTKFTLVKDIKKASTKNYTVKKLTGGTSYSFIVRAYKTVSGKKVYIEDSASCSLAFGSITIVKKKYYADGRVKVTWNPVYAANGYLIEKYDDTTYTWKTVKTITKVKTNSYTFAKADSTTERYRIRAYKKGTPKVYSGGYTIDVDPTVAVPTGVKATTSGDNIVVSWNAVSGADYYVVYRTTNGNYTYDKDTKSYTYYDSSEVSNYVADASVKSGYSKSDDKLTATTITDRKVSYTNEYGIEVTENKGPEADQTYYYYVVAYKYDTSDTVYKDEYSYYSSGCSKAASATVKKTKVSKPTLKSVKASSGKVTVKWKKVKGATGYEVYRSTKKGKGYTLIGTVTKGSKVKYVDKTAKKGTKYYYKVRATKTNEVGTDAVSKYSKVKSVTAK